MMLLKLLNGLDRDRFEPVVLSLTSVGLVGRSIADLGLRVVHLNIPPGRISIRGLWSLRNFIKAEGPDLLQGWMYHGNLAAHVASLLLSDPPPVVWSIRGTHTDLENEKLQTAATIWLCAHLSSRAAAIINNSRVSAAAHANLLGYSRSNVVIIPNGFDTNTFRPDDEAKASVRALLGAHEDTLLIGLVGRVEPVKDHSTFLRAAALVKGRFPHARFVLIGQGADISNAQLMSVIGDCGLEGAVHLLGLRNDLPQLTAALDLTVLSSVSEGFPNVLGEAMSCGICAVSTAAGDAAWIIGNTGAVVPPRRPDSLARAMDRILSMEPEQRRNLGRLGRARVIEHFSLYSVVRQYEALYERLLLPTPMEV